jgi:hypothetical protein
MITCSVDELVESGLRGEPLAKLVKKLQQQADELYDDVYELHEDVEFRGKAVKAKAPAKAPPLTGFVVSVERGKVKLDLTVPTEEEFKEETMSTKPGGDYARDAEEEMKKESERKKAEDHGCPKKQTDSQSSSFKSTHESGEGVAPEDDESKYANHETKYEQDTKRVPDVPIVSAVASNSSTTTVEDEKADSCFQLVKVEESASRVSKWVLPKYNEEVYGPASENGEERLAIDYVYVFTEQSPTTTDECTMMYKVKKWLVNHTYLGAYEAVLPTNMDTTICEEEINNNKRGVAMRWFWEGDYTVFVKSSVYHAFKHAYTHATQKPVYTSIANQCLTNPLLMKMDILEDDSSCRFRKTARLAVTHYLSEHPLHKYLAQHTGIYANTVAHICNQLVVYALRIRACNAAVHSKGPGTIKSPFTSSILQTYLRLIGGTNDPANGDWSTQKVKKVKPNSVQQIFRMKAPMTVSSRQGAYSA